MRGLKRREGDRYTDVKDGCGVGILSMKEN